MQGKFIVTRAGTKKNDHSGSGSWQAQTGVHSSRNGANIAGQAGVPTNLAVFVSRSKYRLEILDKWVSYPSSDSANIQVKCNVCKINLRGAS